MNHHSRWQGRCPNSHGKPGESKPTTNRWHGQYHRSLIQVSNMVDENAALASNTDEPLITFDAPFRPWYVVLIVFAAGASCLPLLIGHRACTCQLEIGHQINRQISRQINISKTRPFSSILFIFYGIFRDEDQPCEVLIEPCPVDPSTTILIDDKVIWYHSHPKMREILLRKIFTTAMAIGPAVSIALVAVSVGGTNATKHQKRQQ